MDEKKSKVVSGQPIRDSIRRFVERTIKDRETLCYIFLQHGHCFDSQLGSRSELIALPLARRMKSSSPFEGVYDSCC